MSYAWVKRIWNVVIQTLCQKDERGLFFFWTTPAIRWEGKSVDRQIDLWTQAGHGLTRRLGKLYGDE